MPVDYQDFKRMCDWKSVDLAVESRFYKEYCGKVQKECSEGVCPYVKASARDS